MQSLPQSLPSPDASATPWRSLARWSLAALAAVCAVPVPAQQQPLETGYAVGRRVSPAQGAFSPAIVHRLRVPPGFRVNLFASGLGKPRMLEVGPDGTVYVTRRDQGDVLALRDANRDGVAEQVSTFGTGLQDVNGIAVQGDTLLLAASTTVWRTPLARFAPQVLISGLPDAGQHANRTVRVAPDGTLVVSVGSSCNNCAEGNQLERATLIRYSAAGERLEVIANGLRNTIGYDWHPRSGALWGMDHGSDFRGDWTPPEELNLIQAGKHYGWPICYGNRVVDKLAEARPAQLALQPGQSKPSGVDIPREDFCAQTEPPVATLPAHSAPLAMRFYVGSSFPAEMRQDAFVALRGSWNRRDPRGYKVVRLHFDAAGRPQFEDFLTGFLDAERLVQWGRPVGLAWLPDGSMLVSDDSNGAIWRVSYGG
ncbi:PQQ-dependent sugar dehydrogenase [Azohydromonas aeria]|uniref:PQQ-dependent sugar dehydrogenase n=1 Tax=Azohydromonas aeria TaxID=2590212 RepID=UPI0012FBCFC2|nr:PQQ-dependent sugar dehydrogenase [Azohydromonas aeria]